VTQGERDRAIVAAYLAGKSSAQVGRLYGLTDRRVLQVLADHGVPRRKAVPPRLTLDLRRKSA
jgi:hypothetical protein